MEKPPDDLVAMGQLQKNFIEFIVRPLWSHLAEFFEPLQSSVDRINANRKKWMTVAGLHRTEREIEDEGEWTQKNAEEALAKLLEEDASERLISRSQSSFKVKESALAEDTEVERAPADSKED